MSDTVPDCDTAATRWAELPWNVPVVITGLGLRHSGQSRAGWGLRESWATSGNTCPAPRCPRSQNSNPQQMWYLVVYQRKPTRLYGGGRVKFLGSRVSCVANLLTALVYQESSLLYSITIVQYYTAVTMSWCETVGGVCDSTQKSVSEIFVVLPNFCLKIVIF